MSSSIHRRLGFAALITTSGVLLSRLSGYLRDAIIAYLHGAGPATDAYYAAFTLPDFLNYMLAGGALSIAFLPIFSRYLAEDREADGWRVFSIIFTTMTSIMLALVVAAELYAEELVPLLVPGFGESATTQAVAMTRIVLPAQLAFYAGGLLQSTLYARERFFAPAMAPLVYNLCILLGGVLLAPSHGIQGFAWGALVGAFAGPLGVPLIATWKELRYRPRLAFREPGFIEFVKLTLPLMLGFGLLSMDEWLGRWFGSSWDATVTHLNNARRLMLVPIAVLGQAAGMAAMPFLARLAAEGKTEERDEVLGLAMRTVTQVTVPAAGLLGLFAGPIVALVFGRGAYGPEDVASTAQLLTLYCLGIPAWGLQAIAVRAFYANRNTLLPMLIASVITLVALPIYFGLTSWIGPRGLPLAASAGMALNSMATVYALRWIGVDPQLRPLLDALLRVLAATVIALIAAVAFRMLCDRLLPRPGTLYDVVVVTGGGLVYCAVGLKLIRPLGLKALARLTGGIEARGRRLWGKSA